MTQHTVIRNRSFYKGVTRDLRSPLQTTKLTYTEGKTVTADGIDLDPDKDCGQGINFCRSIADALKWGPVVVEITVPAKVKIVDTGLKLRAERVVVGPVVDLSRADLAGANLARANLSGADLSGADLSGANLYRANLSGANLYRADLARADLAGADLSGANLAGANLARAYLGGADLGGANLSGADLSGADLSGANLAGANLAGANLAGANLAGANLARANLARAYLGGARGDRYTTLPDGYELTEGLIVRSAK
jgi:uncharacterized protein YjbI with pentapeptide repeats